MSSFTVCNNKKKDCEKQVDTYLDRYCFNATHACTTERVVAATSDCIKPTQASSVTTTTLNFSSLKSTQTTTFTTCPPCQCTSPICTSTYTVSPSGLQLHINMTHHVTVSESTRQSQMESTPAGSNNNIIVLGALLGMSVLLLVVVTTTLVWTCWVLKKKEEVKSGTQRRYIYISDILHHSYVHVSLNKKIFVIRKHILCELV